MSEALLQTAEGRPLPPVDGLTRPFWEAARRHRLALPKCDACGKLHSYPRSWCPHCGSSRLQWAEVSGAATVYSYTVVHRPPNPVFAAEVPYAVAVVALAEGPHIMARIVDCAASTVRIDMALELRFLDLTEEISLPVFAPVGAARAGTAAAAAP